VVNPSILDVTMEDAEAAASSKEPHGTIPAANPNAGAAGVSNADPIEGACGDLTKTVTTASRNAMGHLSLGGVGNKTTNPIMGPPVTPKNSAKSNKLRMYEAAKKACKIVLIPNLHGGNSVVLTPVGGLVMEADNRWQDIKIQLDLSTGTNVSYSFDPNTMECGFCGKFLAGGGGEGGVGLGFLGPEFPPHYTSRGGRHMFENNKNRRGRSAPVQKQIYC
jgi:hypothetical protein